MRNGVTKKLLWIEYCELCRQSGDQALMYSQFCEYIHKDEQKRRATMHIPRKPGEQIEVDWAGDPAHIIDPDTGEITDCWLFVGVLTYSQYTFVEAFMNERTGNWMPPQKGCRKEKRSGISRNTPAFPLDRTKNAAAVKKTRCCIRKHLTRRKKPYRN